MKKLTGVMTFALFYSALVLAIDLSNQWRWVDHQTPSVAVTATPATSYDNAGKPIAVTNINDLLDQNLLDNFYAMVPEAVKVDPLLYANTFDNIEIKDDFTGRVTVKVAFLNEGAGYRNALGYLIYETANPPTPATITDYEHVIIFPNASKQYSGGEMLQGDQVDLQIELTAGQAIAFFIHSNGWNGGAQVKDNFSWGQPFYSLRQLNPTVGMGNKYHVIFNDTTATGYDVVSGETTGFFAYGFEDIRTDNGDKDFNDLIFNVEITPLEAVDNIERAVQIRAVGDQKVTQNGKYAFEDNWPMKGDYDFNDAVIAYQIGKTETELQVEDNGTEYSQFIVSQFSARLTIEALGALYHNGLSLHLADVRLADIDNLYLIKGQDTLNYPGSNPVVYSDASYEYPLISETDTGVLLTLSEDLVEELSINANRDSLAGAQTCYYRTAVDHPLACPSATTANDLTLVINFKDDIAGGNFIDAETELDYNVYDFFLTGGQKGVDDEGMPLFRFDRASDNAWYTAYLGGYNEHIARAGAGPGRALEIHLPQFSGTPYFEALGSYRDGSLFTTVNESYLVDASKTAPFISAPQNLPWVLHLPASWAHPYETVDINDAYPDFINWLYEPANYPKWYTKQQTSAIYQE